MSKPPFTQATANEKVKKAQDLWNTQDPVNVSKVKEYSMVYTEECIWRNRDQFLSGTEAIVEFLRKKWAKEKNYRLRKELFAFTDNKIAVQFWYEYQDVQSGRWMRCYGLEDWTFSDEGKNCKRQMSGNDIEISESERWFKEGVDVNSVKISEKHW